jgi:oxaloacetate decarboxylase alpha subunit
MRTTPLTPQHIDSYSRISISGHRISSSLGKWGIKEILEESIQVRADFGYPIMVTPLSQFVGSQAGINVIVGERYKEVTDEVIQYALGHWGREAIAVMDKDVREKILDRRRTQDFANWEPPSLSLKEVRKMYGENLTDEELILRTYIDEDAVTIARNAPMPRPNLSAGQPLITLLRELGQRPGYTQVQVRQPGFSLTLK